MNTNVKLDDSVRKKQKLINPDTYWMYRLYKWAYGVKPKFKGYCPLFWSVWVTLLISPAIVLYHIFQDLSTIIGSCFLTKVEENKEVKIKYNQPIDEIIIFINEEFEYNKEAYGHLLSEGDNIYSVVTINSYNLDNKIEYFGKTNNYNNKYYWYSHSYTSDALNWLSQNTDNFNTILKEAVERIKIKNEKLNKKSKERAAARVKRQELSDKLIAKVSWTVKPLLIIGGLIGSYYVWQLAYWGITSVPWLEVLKHALQLLIFMVIISIIVLVLYGSLRTIFEYLIKLKSIKIPEIKPAGPSIFDKVGYFISEFFDFIVTSAKLLYLKECPLIIFTDKETKGIEKIEKK